MKIKKIENRQAWSKQDNKDLYALYLDMYDKQEAGEKFNKAAMIRKFQETHERTKGSIECKLMNASAVRKNVLHFDVVTGYKALNNFNHNFAQYICDYHGFTYEK